MNGVKGINVVKTTNGWAVCQSNTDGTELFIVPDVFEPGYTQAHAQLAADDLKRHLETGGKTYAKPLPAGIRVVS